VTADRRYDRELMFRRGSSATGDTGAVSVKPGNIPADSEARIDGASGMNVLIPIKCRRGRGGNVSAPGFNGTSLRGNKAVLNSRTWSA
jgi:hypothetical protein